MGAFSFYLPPRRELSLFTYPLEEKNFLFLLLVCCFVGLLVCVRRKIEEVEDSSI